VANGLPHKNEQVRFFGDGFFELKCTQQQMSQVMEMMPKGVGVRVKFPNAEGDPHPALFDHLRNRLYGSVLVVAREVEQDTQ
jgi:hypothetical protein